MREVTDTSDPLVGSMLGKDYRVQEAIGFGGMAVVYMVEHQTLLKQFAAKVLSKELAANREARARFTQEAHAASQLDHENIVNISDFGVTSDQRPFFVMELLRGQTLDQRIAAGPLAIEEIVAISVPVGRALAYAHAEGIVHRDVKPENIFLVQRSQGRFGIKVVDFGIAKTPINQRLTAMGQTLGSPMFMSPEACRGEEVDHRADIYSFGILLYLMFCGRLPFEDPSLLKVLQMQVQNPLPPPRLVNPALSPELAAVIEQALAKDADVRYLSMDALLKDFESALPSGADQMLIDVQVGASPAFRTTPFPGSQRISQPLVTARASQSSLAPPMPAPPAKSPIRLIAILAVLFGVCGVAFAVYKLLSAEPHATQAAATPAPPPPAPAPAPQTPPVVAAAPIEDTAPAKTSVQLVVDTAPQGATVKLDGKKLGITPISLSVTRADTGKLVVTKSGYESVTAELKLSDDARVSYELEREESRKGSVAKRPGKTAKPPSTGSATPPKGDPNLEIKLSR
ncbi:MAG TPA: serine/threonine-protein kinase [Kofleriaceae bacterium]